MLHAPTLIYGALAIPAIITCPDAGLAPEKQFFLEKNNNLTTHLEDNLITCSHNPGGSKLLFSLAIPLWTFGFHCFAYCTRLKEVHDAVENHVIDLSSDQKNKAPSRLQPD